MPVITSLPASHVLVEAGRRVAGRGLWLVGRLSALWRGRRALNDLAEMDAAMLADIGLTRADVNAAFGVPLDRDPTEWLAQAVRRAR